MLGRTRVWRLHGRRNPSRLVQPEDRVTGRVHSSETTGPSGGQAGLLAGPSDPDVHVLLLKLGSIDIWGMFFRSDFGGPGRSMRVFLNLASRSDPEVTTGTEVSAPATGVPPGVSRVVREGSALPPGPGVWLPWESRALPTPGEWCHPKMVTLSTPTAPPKYHGVVFHAP